MSNHEFCRQLLRQIMPAVRQRFTPDQIKSAWAWHQGREHYEFHGPGDHFDHNLQFADCLSSAKAEGWQRLFDKLDDMNLRRQARLYYCYRGKTRTRDAITVSIYTINVHSTTGKQMENISKFVAESLQLGHGREKDGRDCDFVVCQSADTIASQLGQKVYSDPAAFTWEWLD